MVKRPELGVSAASMRVSLALQAIAANLDKQLSAAAGEPVSFSLFVWTQGRANYIANSTDRVEIKCALHSVIDGWDQGMPDVPAHEFKG